MPAIWTKWRGLLPQGVVCCMTMHIQALLQKQPMLFKNFTLSCCSMLPTVLILHYSEMPTGPMIKFHHTSHFVVAVKHEKSNMQNRMWTVDNTWTTCGLFYKKEWHLRGDVYHENKDKKDTVRTYLPITSTSPIRVLSVAQLEVASAFQQSKKRNRDTKLTNAHRVRPVQCLSST